MDFLQLKFHMLDEAEAYPTHILAAGSVHLSRRERSIAPGDAKHRPVRSGEGFRSLDRAKPLTRAFGATSPYGRGGTADVAAFRTKRRGDRE